MDLKVLENIVVNQNKIIDQMDPGFTRDKLESISKLINKTNIVITGHRRVGKSTLLLQIMQKYYRNNYYYLNFLDERLVDFEINDFQKLYEIFQKNYGEKSIFFFDEVQGRKGWDKFVARIYETKKQKFIITGSNSELLSKEISTYLTGRHTDIELFPFSFKEYLEYNKFDLDIRVTKNKINIQNQFKEYLEKGGFPEVVVNDNTSFLENIYLDVIYRDIFNRYKIKEQEMFKKIAQYLISNCSNEFNYSSIQKIYKDIKSKNTIKKYITYLTNTYTLFELNRFNYSLKNQESYNKKIYCIDTGLINKMAFKFSENLGKAYENLVFVELKRRSKEIYYYKNLKNQECDFIIKEGLNIVEAIQVTYDMSDIKTKEREIKGLLSCLDEFKLKEGIIITDNLEKEEIIDGKKIRYIPIINWLLS